MIASSRGSSPSADPDTQVSRSSSRTRHLAADEPRPGRDQVTTREATASGPIGEREPVRTLHIATAIPHMRGADVRMRYLERGRPALVGPSQEPEGWLFPSAHGPRPLGANAISLMLTRRYHAGGGTLHSFGSHRIRHATATLLVNNGMPLEEVSRYLGHSSTEPTRRYARQTPDTLGIRAAEALARAGLIGA